MEDLYEVLGVQKTASKEDIKKKYHVLMRSLHPDRNPGLQNSEAEVNIRECQRVNNAYGILSDESKRSYYDLYGLEEPGEQVGQQDHDDDIEEGGYYDDICNTIIFLFL